MKMPNFRLPETRATAAMLLGVVGLVSLAGLSFLVFYHFSFVTYTIGYNEMSTFGRFRKILVMLGAAITVILGATALAIGFQSLGQKRNSRQGRSFLGMATGGLAIALAPVLLFLWINRSEAIIQKVAQ